MVVIMLDCNYILCNNINVCLAGAVLCGQHAAIYISVLASGWLYDVELGGCVCSSVDCSVPQSCRSFVHDHICWYTTEDSPSKCQTEALLV